MAITIIAPKFSFLSYNDDDNQPCSDTDRPCLPVYALTDLAFQFYASVTGADKATFNDDPIDAGILDNPDICGNPMAAPGYSNYTGHWTKITTGSGAEPDIWIGRFVYADNGNWANNPVGGCFYIKLFQRSAGTGYNCISQCFIKIADKCYTSLLSYKNNSNAFDFDYDTTSSVETYNMVRLPMYLHSPINADDQKSYDKSNGSTQKISHRIWKDYKVKTDWWPDEWLDKFAIATAHDTLIVDDTYSNQNALFIRTDKIEVDWHQEDTPRYALGMGKTTLRLAAPQANVNSNCQ